jgi:hypothetical protein
MAPVDPWLVQKSAHRLLEQMPSSLTFFSDG